MIWIADGWASNGDECLLHAAKKLGRFSKTVRNRDLIWID
jgi:hypothetical protein